MIKLSDVKKSYYLPSGRIDVLKGVTLSFPDKGLIFIVGKLCRAHNPLKGRKSNKECRFCSYFELNREISMG